MGGVIYEPMGVTVPLHAPLSTQEEAVGMFQLRAMTAPGATVEALALKEAVPLTTGVGEEETLGVLGVEGVEGVLGVVGGGGGAGGGVEGGGGSGGGEDSEGGT